MRASWAGVALAAGLLFSTTGCAGLDGGTSTTVGAPHAANTAAPSKQEAKPLPMGLDPAADRDPFPSTYKPLPSRPTAIVGANSLNQGGDLSNVTGHRGGDRQ